MSKNDLNRLFRFDKETVKQMLDSFKYSQNITEGPTKLDMYYQIIDNKLYKVIDGDYIPVEEEIKKDENFNNPLNSNELLKDEEDKTNKNEINELDYIKQLEQEKLMDSLSQPPLIRYEPSRSRKF
jgi:hypothetical protein